MDNPGDVLRFGNLSDIIFIKEAEIKLLQEKINALHGKIGNPEECELYGDNGCCSLEKECEKDRESCYTEIKIFEEEKNKISAGLFILYYEYYYKIFHDSVE